MCNAIYYQLSTLDLFTVVIVDLYPIDYSYEACFPSPLKMTHNFFIENCILCRVTGAKVDRHLGLDFTLICMVHRLCLMLTTDFKFLPVVPLFSILL